MEIRFVTLDLPKIDQLPYETVVLHCFEDERPLRGAAGLCDWRLCGKLSKLLMAKRISGSANEALLMPAQPRLPFDKLVLLGLGPQQQFTQPRFSQAVTHWLSVVNNLKLRTVVTTLPGRNIDAVSAEDAIRWFLPAVLAQPTLDEVVVLDTHDAQRVMSPIVIAEQRRIRSALEIDE